MAFEWVKDALQSHFVNGMQDLKNDIAWKNLPFAPGDRKLWLKVIYVPVQEEAETLGLHGENGFRGFLQIGIYQRINEGTELSDSVINRINNLFKVTQRLDAPPSCMLRLENKMSSQGGQTSQADMSAGGTETVWDSNYITIFWLAREPR